MYIKMESDSFTDEEFGLLLDNVKNDSGILIYPYVRKNLLILPKEDERVKRYFLTFSMTKISHSYAINKGYADWAVTFVGYWDSSANFRVKNESIMVAFF